MENACVSVVKCADYDAARVNESVRQAVDLLGGIGKFVKPGSRVLLKPNLLMPKGPEAAITTHPQVIRAVIRMLKEIKCSIVVGDGPSVWGRYIEDVDAVYEATGVRALCAEEGVKLMKFEHRRWHGKFPMTTVLDEVDCFVNLPKFKTHELTLLTGAVKNLFGLISGTFKTELHKNHFDRRDFSTVLADIYQEARPALTLVDGILALEGDGPATAGKPKKLGLLLAGSDCVALDSIMALIMGVEPHDVLSTKEAALRGLGESRREHITVAGEKLEGLLGTPFLLPTSSLATSWKKKLPKPVVEIAKRLIRYYPCVEHDHCIKCAACIDSCPNKIIKFDTKKRITFAYSRCIACFCCQEACPASAVKVRKSFFAKLAGL